MDLKFYEKLSILLVLFLGVTIGTASIIGNYVGMQNKNNNQQKDNVIILENIPF